MGNDGLETWYRTLVSEQDLFVQVQGVLCSVGQDPLPGAPRIVRSARQGVRGTEEKVFKPQGGMGVKGGHAPTPLAGASPALRQAPGALAQ